MEGWRWNADLALSAAGRRGSWRRARKSPVPISADAAAAAAASSKHANGPATEKWAVPRNDGECSGPRADDTITSSRPPPSTDSKTGSTYFSTRTPRGFYRGTIIFSSSVSPSATTVGSVINTEDRRPSLRPRKHNKIGIAK